MFASRNRYSPGLRMLHWFMAVLILAAYLAVEQRGLFARGTPARAAMMQTHYWMGLCVLAFALWLFLVKTPIEEAEVRRELMQEYRALMRFLLHDQGQLCLCLTAAGEHVEVGYALTRDPKDVLQYIRGIRRFLRLVPAEAPANGAPSRTLLRAHSPQ